MKKTKIKINKTLRVEVVAFLWHYWNSQGYGLYHAMWKLAHNKTYEQAWTPKERALVQQKLQELYELLEFFSLISRRLRHGR